MGVWNELSLGTGAAKHAVDIGIGYSVTNGLLQVAEFVILNANDQYISDKSDRF
jgi:hypothetical protein